MTTPDSAPCGYALALLPLLPGSVPLPTRAGLRGQDRVKVASGVSLRGALPARREKHRLALIVETGPARSPCTLPRRVHWQGVVVATVETLKVVKDDPTSKAWRRPGCRLCAGGPHLRAALAAMTHKTDRNDARGIAQVLRTGWFKAVHVKTAWSQERRTLLTARKRMLEQPSTSRTRSEACSRVRV